MLKIANWWRGLDWTERGGAVMAGIGFAFVLIALVWPMVRVS